MKLLDALIIIFTIEKAAQHFLTALFLVVDIPNIAGEDQEC